MMQLDDDTEFLIAVDSVTGSFSDNGTWQITAQIADAVNNELYVFGIRASSWILCYEPPVDPRKNPGSRTQQGLRTQGVRIIGAGGFSSLTGATVVETRRGGSRSDIDRGAEETGEHSIATT
jgi:hypothetical protein